eukprot:g3950.t1
MGRIRFRPLRVVLLVMAASTASGAARPNLVFILSDDQDAHTTGYNESGIAFMPLTNAALRAPGALFANHLLATPLCAPSRAVILTGRYPHNTGVFLNSPTHGAYAFWERNENKSVAVALQRAGYETFLMGKYMNGYGHRPEHVPPGWTHWRGFTDVSYFAPQVSEQGRLVKYNASVYSTDLIRDGALAFLRARNGKGNSAGALGPKPFFMYLAPKAPHAPFTPAPRHAALFPAGLRVPRTAAFNDASDDAQRGHCSWIGALPRLSAAATAKLDADFTSRVRALQAVDELVHALVLELARAALLNNTFVLYMGDNGFHQGHHRMPNGKQTVFEEDVRVPMLLRGPGVRAGATWRGLTGNYDVAPTLLHMAGLLPGAGVGVSAGVGAGAGAGGADGAAPPPMDVIDGQSLLPLVTGGAGGAAAWGRPFALQEGFYGCYPDVKAGDTCDGSGGDAPGPAPTFSPPAAACNATLEQDTNVKAHAIGAPRNASGAGECCALCAATPGCALWTWNARTSRSLCALKSARGGATASPGTVTGTMGGGPRPPGPAPRNGTGAWSYRGLRWLEPGRDLTYAEWCNGEVELYNNTADPLQRRNLARAAEPEPPTALLGELAAALESVRQCAGASCPGGAAVPQPDPAFVRKPFPCMWPA